MLPPAPLGVTAGTNAAPTILTRPTTIDRIFAGRSGYPSITPAIERQKKWRSKTAPNFISANFIEDIIILSITLPVVPVAAMISLRRAVFDAVSHSSYSPTVAMGRQIETKDYLHPYRKT